jgi:hypothetical protein
VVLFWPAVSCLGVSGLALLWETATPAKTVVIINANDEERRKNEFMLDLLRWQRVSEASAFLDAKPPGERCFYSNLRGTEMEKTLLAPEGQGLVECVVM